MAGPRLKERIITNTQKLPPKIREYLEKVRVPMSVANLTDDMALVFANDAFCHLTGYSRDEIVGRNCRFLQGVATIDETRQDLSDFLQDTARDSGRFPVVNYRKNGSEFDNFVFMTRLRAPDRETRFILASQVDLTSTTRRANLLSSDRKLLGAMSDLDRMTREAGLTMVNSAQAISDSVALLAKISLDNDSI